MLKTSIVVATVVTSAIAGVMYLKKSNSKCSIHGKGNGLKLDSVLEGLGVVLDNQKKMSDKIGSRIKPIDPNG